MTSRLKIRLSEIAYEAMDYVDESSALDPANSEEPQIVERVGDRLAIVDGFHRTAGQIRWCREREIAPADCEITVVCCDDADLIAAAAEPGPGQADAIRQIYANL